ncbi:hypothetical protein HPB47_005027 [Ixodes persulcatus]|uniref:Uncharacterized protein n=1 Tax=Ixodes persulcatus TaxID=34615 RepID=A0AC60PF20_IXOPE|nr:hypothetical protein HPB47_005027 [Ixodes persulcatus]
MKAGSCFVPKLSWIIRKSNYCSLQRELGKWRKTKAASHHKTEDASKNSIFLGLINLLPSTRGPGYEKTSSTRELHFAAAAVALRQPRH